MSQKVTNTYPERQQIDDILGEQTGLQGTVRIDKIIKEKMEAWLQTDMARELGFYSNSDFVTKSVREALEKYAVPPEIPIRLFIANNKDHLLDLDLDVYKKSIICARCESDKCVHIEKIKSDKSVQKYIKDFVKSKERK